MSKTKRNKNLPEDFDWCDWLSDISEYQRKIDEKLQDIDLYIQYLEDTQSEG